MTLLPQAKCVTFPLPYTNKDQKHHKPRRRNEKKMRLNMNVPANLIKTGSFQRAGNSIKLMGCILKTPGYRTIQGQGWLQEPGPTYYLGNQNMNPGVNGYHRKKLKGQNRLWCWAFTQFTVFKRSIGLRISVILRRRCFLEAYLF